MQLNKNGKRTNSGLASLKARQLVYNYGKTINEALAIFPEAGKTVVHSAVTRLKARYKNQQCPCCASSISDTRVYDLEMLSAAGKKVVERNSK
jgi:hypothetical protein